MRSFSYEEIADYFIALSNKSENLITNLKLQKLVYYLQAWHYTLFKEKLFEKEFQAWIHGPVLPDLYQDYKHFKWKPIDKNVGDESIDSVEDKLNAEQKELFNQVVDEYFGLSAYELERLTHAESPWKNARKGKEPDEISREPISYKDIEEYYSKFIEQ